MINMIMTLDRLWTSLQHNYSACHKITRHDMLFDIESYFCIVTAITMVQKNYYVSKERNNIFTVQTKINAGCQGLSGKKEKHIWQSAEELWQVLLDAYKSLPGNFLIKLYEINMQLPF